jgi:hypothetical protein
VIAVRLRRLGCACLTVLLFSAAGATEANRGPAWASLTAPQKVALAPLQHDWQSIDELRKQKWIEVAARFPTMPADERARVQARMTEWARMTPADRASARLQFQEARRLPADERQAKWQAYQALSPEERSTLAERARPAAKAASAPEAPRAVRSDLPTAKRNLVPASASPPASAGAHAGAHAGAIVVAPTVVQARPGATTTTMGVGANPPPHHQAGMPKIAATPGFVDAATLLPQRGPQGAAAQPVASSESAKQQP